MTVSRAWTPASNSWTAVALYGLFAYDGDGHTGLYGSASATCTTGTITGLTSGRTDTIVV